MKKTYGKSHTDKTIESLRQFVMENGKVDPKPTKEWITDTGNKMSESDMKKIT